MLICYKFEVDVLSVRQSELFGSLDSSTRRLIDALVEDRGVFSAQVEAQTEAISEMHRNSNFLARKEHEKTRTIIIEALDGSDLRMQLMIRNHASRKQGIPSRIPSPFGNDDYEAEARRGLIELEIFKSLKFASYEAWREEIPIAHQRTFRWIFKERTENSIPISFSQWLENGNGVYWINGKAGSGKSTLMKFIFSHDQTQKHLSKWAPENLEFAGFFLLNSGTLSKNHRSAYFALCCTTCCASMQSSCPRSSPMSGISDGQFLFTILVQYKSSVGLCLD